MKAEMTEMNARAMKKSASLDNTLGLTELLVIVSGVYALDANSVIHRLQLRQANKTKGPNICFPGSVTVDA